MAELKEVSELDMLKLAAAADAGLETIPEDKPKEEAETTETSSGDILETPATPETTETKSTSDDVVTDKG